MITALFYMEEWLGSMDYQCDRYFVLQERQCWALSGCLDENFSHFTTEVYIVKWQSSINP